MINGTSAPQEIIFSQKEQVKCRPILAIEEACSRIAPLWPLKDFVAVNPFLGLSDRHFLEAATLFRRVGHGEMMMPDDYYLDRLDSGHISDEDIQDAVAFAKATIPPPWSAFLTDYSKLSLRQELSKTAEKNQDGLILSFADYVDRSQGTCWASFITDEISKWCSVYFDEGQSSWRMPWRDQSLYSAWRQAAQYDANPGLSGLPAFNRIMRTLPEEPSVTISEVLSLLAIPPSLHADFLHRQLLSIGGWSAHAQYRARQDAFHRRTNSALAELLAIRLAYDLALWEQFRSETNLDLGWKRAVLKMQQFNPALDQLPRYLLLCASEKSYQRRLASKLVDDATDNTANVRYAVHAVFCIDVRSEVYRRHLEAQDPTIRTSGFAGFFGIPIEYIPLGQRHGSPQCPVLFAPTYRVREGLQNENAEVLKKAIRLQLFGRRINHAWNAFKTSAISCFSFVETVGFWFGYKLGRDSLGLGHDDQTRIAAHTGPRLESDHGHGIPLAHQIVLAEGILRNLGLASNFARVVLVCGHGSATTNNPYASSLDCGACGGHAGQINARIAARLLNDAKVKLALSHRGIKIPDDTYFLAAQHNTTTDQVELFDESALPSSHQDDVARLSGWLRLASQGARVERAERFGFETRDDFIQPKIEARSRDWAEVRPEWGLANNAALIAAPRSRTQGLNLEGRAFLHDYDASADAEGKVLELILTAPVVVANWINLQYYASTVNNPLFGSGNKTIHNVVGAMGIWQGNGGDLQVGLPLQSLHNGKTWMHEPLRLSVYVQASQEAINRILAIHPEIRELVQNGWMALFAMGPGNDALSQYVSNLMWKPLTPSNSKTAPISACV